MIVEIDAEMGSHGAEDGVYPLAEGAGDRSGHRSIGDGEITGRRRRIGRFIGDRLVERCIIGRGRPLLLFFCGSSLLLNSNPLCFSSGFLLKSKCLCLSLCCSSLCSSVPR